MSEQKWSCTELIICSNLGINLESDGNGRLLSDELKVTGSNLLASSEFNKNAKLVGFSCMERSSAYHQQHQKNNFPPYSQTYSMVVLNTFNGVAVMALYGC